MFNPIRMFKDKMQAFRVARQAGALRELAETKKSTRVKSSRSTKVPYQPGSLGLSQVSTDIKKEYGSILSRHKRKQMATQSRRQNRK
jgi:hypothetical protein